METSSGEPKLNDHIRIIENHIQYNKNKFFQFLSQFLKMKMIFGNTPNIKFMMK